MAFSSLKTMGNTMLNWEDTGSVMPVLFVGHGAPIYVLGDNEYSRQWKKIAASIPKPRAIVCISAHWLTRGTHVTAMENPRTIHDFGRFDDRLFDLFYEAPGSPDLAQQVSENVQKTTIHLDEDWGFDHGTWCVLIKMYPKADIPVIQLSIDYHKPAQYHYDLARELSFLRKKGVLILCSGNIVHNLRRLDFSGQPEFDWAKEFDEAVVKHIDSRNHQPLINYQNMGKAAQLSIPTPDHYYPLLYALGLQGKKDEATYPVEGFSFRSTSMRAVLLGES